MYSLTVNTFQPFSGTSVNLLGNSEIIDCQLSRAKANGILTINLNPFSCDILSMTEHGFSYQDSGQLKNLVTSLLDVRIENGTIVVDMTLRATAPKEFHEHVELSYTANAFKHRMIFRDSATIENFLSELDREAQKLHILPFTIMTHDLSQFRGPTTDHVYPFFVKERSVEEKWHPLLSPTKLVSGYRPYFIKFLNSYIRYSHLLKDALTVVPLLYDIFGFWYRVHNSEELFTLTADNGLIRVSGLIECPPYSQINRILQTNFDKS